MPYNLPRRIFCYHMGLQVTNNFIIEWRVQIGVFNEIFEGRNILLISLASLERYSFVRNRIRYNFYEK